MAKVERRRLPPNQTTATVTARMTRSRIAMTTAHAVDPLSMKPLMQFSYEDFLLRRGKGGGKNVDVQHSIDHPDNNHHTTDPDVRVRNPRLLPNLLIAPVVRVPQYCLRHQGYDGENTNDLVTFGEGRIQGIHSTERNCDDEAKDRHHGGEGMKHPMEFKRAKPTQHDHAKREEEQE